VSSIGRLNVGVARGSRRHRRYSQSTSPSSFFPASRRWPDFKAAGGSPLQHRTVGDGTAHVACDDEPCRRTGMARAVASANLVVFLWYSARESNTWVLQVMSLACCRYTSYACVRMATYVDQNHSVATNCHE